jgi:hypothetical protein
MMRGTRAEPSVLPLRPLRAGSGGKRPVLELRCEWPPGASRAANRVAACGGLGREILSLGPFLWHTAWWVRDDSLEVAEVKLC